MTTIAKISRASRRFQRGLSPPLSVFLFWGFFATPAAEQAPASPPTSSAPIRSTSSAMSPAAIELIRQFASGTLTKESAEALLGPSAKTERRGDYWQIRATKPAGATIVLPSQGSSMAELRVELAARLHLGDLAGNLGAWRSVSESETSSVLFRYRQRSGRPVAVFVRLLARHPSPDAPVQSMVLRPDTGPP